MISKNSQNKKTAASFLSESIALGIHFAAPDVELQRDYIDLEGYFLSATYNLRSARITEGFLCWLLRYGHLLSPSKIRRLINKGFYYNPQVLGALISYISESSKNYRQWRILTPFTQKGKILGNLYDGPRPHMPNPHFIKFNLITHNFKLDADKFLRPRSTNYAACLELRNRAIYGSIVHADIVSYLNYMPGATAYQIAKYTVHHRARIYEVLPDILEANPALKTG